MMPMLGVAEVVAVSEEVADFTGAASVAAACMPDASTAALEGFMAAAVAMQDVYARRIR
jgi:hypothetical protein